MKSKNIIFVTIILEIALIASPVVYKINKVHNETLVVVVEKEFLYNAKKCYYNDECSSTVTLDELVNMGYLTNLTNPTTKKYYSAESYVLIDTEEIVLID